MKRKSLLLLLLLFCGCQPSAPPSNSGGGVGRSNTAQDDALFGAPRERQIDKGLPLPDMPDAAPAVTRNFYFVIDGSDSMKYRVDHRNRLEVAKDAVRAFLKTIPDDANIGLFVFDAYGAREVVPLGINNRQPFLSKVEAIRYGNNTPLGEAVQTGSEALFKQRAKQLDYGEYRLIVVTDGEANGEVSITDAAKYASDRQVPLYTIGLAMGRDHELRRYSVTYKAADSEEDLKSGLEEAIGESKVFDAASFEPDPGAKK